MRHLPFRMPSVLRSYFARWNARHFFMLSGIVFALVILASTNSFVAYERKLALAAESEHGRLYTNALENHISEALSSIDNSVSSLGQILDKAVGATRDQYSPAQVTAVNKLIESAVIDSTRLRSISILDASGQALFSSNQLVVGRRYDLATLGLRPDMGNTLEPGRPQFVRDLHQIDAKVSDTFAQQRADGVYVIPFARTMVLDGQRLIVLAMVSPGSFFPEYRAARGPEVGYAALFDYQGNVLSATPGAEYVAGGSYPALPIFAQLQRDIEYGQYRSETAARGGGANGYIVNFRATRKFPLVAVIGMSEAQAVERWSSGSQNLTWLGIAAAVVVLLYTTVLWKVMRYRENFEHDLKAAKEAAEQANAARGSFLSTMSHEIRTPMNAVIGMTGLLRETPLDSQQQEFIKAVDESANALMAIIDEILDFSRIDSGMLHIEEIDCHLVPIVEGSLEVLSTKAREKGLSLMSYIEPGLPSVVSGDPGRLRQILLNLIGNAVKFTPSGEITVSVLGAGRQRGQTLIRFEVADTGIGIDADTIPRLFTPFTQADGSVTRKYGGTGLGLSICKRLVELMGGTIGVYSNPGKGSTFWFELPMNVPAGASGANVPKPRAAIRLMVVEPHRRQAEILRAYGKSWGMQVSVATSAAEALKQQRDGAGTQVAIIDSELPDMPSADLVNEMTVREPAIRFVMLTRDPDMREDAILHGFHAVLMQPIRQSTLFDGLVAAMERRQSNLPIAVERRTIAPEIDARRALGDGRLILLVEDNLMNQQLAVHQLKMLGYAADIANNGQEALDSLATVPYALVLMDCQMPVMDGFEATRRIRKTEEMSGGHIQIVAMTANAMQGDRERCLEAGMDDYLAKPIMRDLLAAMLEKHMPAHVDTSSVSDCAPLMLNMQRLSDMFGDDPAFQKEMLDLFITTTRPVLDHFGLAIARRAFSEALVQAHRMLGSCSNLGMEELTELARAAERASHAEDLQRLKQLHEAMLLAFARLTDFVGRMKVTL